MYKYINKHLILIGMIALVNVPHGSNATLNEQDEGWSFYTKRVPSLPSQSLMEKLPYNTDTDMSNILDTRTPMGWFVRQLLEEKGNVHIKDAFVRNTTWGDGPEKGKTESVSFTCYIKPKKSKQEELLDLQIQIKKKQLEILLKNNT
jgi:hypothetical protein